MDYRLFPSLVFLVVSAVALQPSVIAASAASCSFPPELWCTSPEISRVCEVEAQCAQFQRPTNDAPLVNFTLYYESYCPGCQMFINGQLHDTYMAVSEIMNLTLVPYGNAKEMKKGSKYEFTCQHGERECRGNLLESCVLHFAPFPTAFKTIYCMEVTHNPVPNAQECITKFGLNYEQIVDCANGSLGNFLEHEMALKTNALKPPHNYVPWVTLNGVHTDAIQQKAESDLKKLICDTYRGNKPPACSQENTQPRSYI
ncbi:gamma-interferon-inducible lysosomal thiol reductase-like [Acanthaster planci]|uniref:Gamma-interferon-inducible lysosomal thiol reductase-like n=1 Tax=Acanthaster planci TaxID=133434 RepID=A0A8B7ZCX6_ACAPL|nr:gamma-interferon-inducible lysosomal thiol reductase-like [Acanthaster planci]